MTIWGTGLGPLPSGSDADPPIAGDLRGDVTVYVDGRALGLPGVDQINFQLPAQVRERCFVPLAIFAGSQFSTGTRVAVSSGFPCKSEFGLMASTLASLDAGRILRIAILSYWAANGMQTIQSWLGSYDAAGLCYLANGEGAGLPDGAAYCAPNHTFDGTFGSGFIPISVRVLTGSPSCMACGRIPIRPSPWLPGPNPVHGSFLQT